MSRNSNFQREIKTEFTPISNHLNFINSNERQYEVISAEETGTFDPQFKIKTEKSGN